LFERLGHELTNYVDKPGGLIPALQFCQSLMGYIPQEAMTLISERLGEPLHKVFGVVTFYSFFSTQPRGRYTVRVCLGTACYVRGGTQVLDALKKHLGIEVGQTTADRLFSLDIGRCFGACGLAPVIMINDDVHQQVKAAKIAQILDLYRHKEMESQS
jgi:NADH:ubiquinone oxidoreductase subunit E